MARLRKQEHPVSLSIFLCFFYTGPRGASAFVLGEFVAELEGVAHGYLAALSDGALALRLRLDGDRVSDMVA